jgi:hypothetical protein
MYTAKQVKLHTVTGSSVAVTEYKRKPVINTGNGTPYSGLVSATTGDIFYDVSASVAYWWNGTSWLNFNRYTDEVRIGTSSQKPENPPVGLIWLNTTTEKPEWYSGLEGGWKTFAGDVTAAGGTTYILKDRLSGILLWFDLSDTDNVLVNAGTILKILDKSGLNNHTTTVGGLIPYNRRIQNGLNMMDGSHTNAGFTGTLTGASVASSNYTLFMVHTIINSGIESRWDTPLLEFSDGTTNNKIALATIRQTPQPVKGYTTKNNTTISLSTSGSADWLTPCITVLTVSSAAQRMYLNGNLGSNLTAGSYPSYTFNQYILNTGNPGGSDYGELILINSAITDAKRQEVEGYLAHKWGIASKLPTGHPHKSVAPQ